MEELRLKTALNTEAWGLGTTACWDVDFDDGTISFTSPGLLVVAPVQVVGTFDEADGSWMWGWDHPSVEPRLAADARLVRDFGERHELSRYTRRIINCAEDEAWQFTALACHLAHATGAYRGPAGGSTFVFMTFHDVKIRGNI